ncbi:hypothetical protein MED121_08943 [Marinomonas sp. MED121]|uniref:hypothetical protein n=1 Tax=Marinomonas sp. MED121 TaxID=314277 RepID=UPI000069007A|nr:hypothetical protein [Marinomonas sp. MED121]EAQ65679.1 hypothetical protein MED121_08943 [Marinomonas sp. MED121]
MRFDILDSDFLTDLRWGLIKSKVDAYVFLIITSIILASFSMYYIYDIEKKIEKQFISKKRSPFEISKNTNNFNHKGLNVLLLGGSTSRELTGQNKYYSEEITNLCGRKVNFINAGSSSQSYIASRTIYSQFREKNKIDLVVIGTNYFRYILPKSEISSDTLNTKQMKSIPFNLFIEEFPISQNLPAIEPIYYIAKINSLKKTNKIRSYKRVKDNKKYFQAFHNKYTGEARSTSEKEKIASHFLLSRYSDFQNHSEFGANHWNKFIKNAKSNGSQVIFLALPEDLSLQKVSRYFEPLFSAHLKSHKENGAKIIDWRSKELGLKKEDFYDQQHLLKSGRRKLSAPLNNLIKSNLSRCINND